MIMRKLFPLFGIASVTIFINGCVSSGLAPQDVPLQCPDGKAVIIKDIYELPPVENHQLTGTEIIKVFFPKVDNAKINFSMTALKIPSGIKQPKYKQTSSQIIQTISGGGKLQIGNNIIVLKKGIVVYVPPNAEMSITNNVDQILELLTITSPPFAPSQLTLLEEKPSKVKIAKDQEDDREEPVDIQDVAEKYRAESQARKRSLSVEEYRKKISQEPPANDKDDAIAKLLEENETATTPQEPKDSWPLKMPDSSKEPLNKLEKEQEEKLLPPVPQKAEDTKLDKVQELSKEEHAVPLRDENTAPVKEMKDDELEKLLKEQDQQKRLHPKPVTKVKKTSLKNIQELSPEEEGIKPQRRIREESLEKPLKNEKGVSSTPVTKVKKTSLKNIQELKPEEKKVKPTTKKISPLEDLLEEQKTKGVPPKEVKKVKKIGLENIQELAPEEKAAETSKTKVIEDPLEKILKEQKEREKALEKK